MLCDFHLTAAPAAFTCSRCGRTVRVRTREAAKHVRAECQVIDLGQAARRRTCVHLGRQIGTEDCPSCRGRVAVKVFDCLHERHEQTTLAECARCGDYAPAQPLPGEPRRMLLRFPHGFGDAVQLTTVLLHLKAMYPQWSVDVAAKQGAHTLFAGLCRRAFRLREEPPAEGYDVRRTLWWHEPDACYADSPSTKAERCLRDVFRIAPREAYCRYQINPGPVARRKARRYADELGGPFVLIHYQGNSARRNKNLDERAVGALCEEVIRHGHIPVILDWDGRSRLVDGRRARCPAADHPLWGGTGSGDGATLAALAERAAWCVGIDSGPGHVFGATNTPTAIVWTRHHPLHYYGLADNVTHLVPRGHRRLLRDDKDAGMRYFKDKYRHRVYWDLPRTLPRLAEERLSTNVAFGSVSSVSISRLGASPGYGGVTEPGLAPKRLINNHRAKGDDLIVDGDHWVRRQHRQADMVIVRDVYLEDCYRVAELPQAPRYVVDVGAHLGTFAARLRCRRAVAKIVCVEANPANLPALRANVGEFAEIVPAACTYEPEDVGLLSTVFDGTDNTGGSTIAPIGSTPWNNKSTKPHYRPSGVVPKITLEDLARQFDLPRIDLLKLDCEGSELSILEHCDLSLLRHVVGEYHDRRRFHDLIRRRYHDWHLRILRDGPLGTFWLWR